jgi:hypothetical protein
MVNAVSGMIIAGEQIATTTAIACPVKVNRRCHQSRIFRKVRN